MDPASVTDAHPHLQEWLIGSTPEHPLHSDVDEAVLAAFERLLASIDEVRDLVLGLPLTGGEDRCEWDGVVLAARQEISADATKPSEVIVRFNGGLGAT